MWEVDGRSATFGLKPLFSSILYTVDWLKSAKWLKTAEWLKIAEWNRVRQLFRETLLQDYLNGLITHVSLHDIWCISLILHKVFSDIPFFPFNSFVILSFF